VKSNVDLESKGLSMLPLKVQIKFAKAPLGVNKQAVNLAVLGELEIFVYPMLPVSLDCRFLIATSVFSNVYLMICARHA
jgi:hypothetical protein